MELNNYTGLTSKLLPQGELLEIKPDGNLDKLFKIFETELQTADNTSANLVLDFIPISTNNFLEEWIQISLDKEEAEFLKSYSFEQKQIYIVGKLNLIGNGSVLFFFGTSQKPWIRRYNNYRICTVSSG